MKNDNSVQFMTEKLVISGQVIEHYQYSVPIRLGVKRSSYRSRGRRCLYRRTPEGGMTMFFDKSANVKRSDNLRRSKQKLIRLINSNSDFKTFLTLTFEENLTDLSVANKFFDRFIKRLRYFYPSLKYVAVPEFQKRGAVHYHLLTNIVNIPQVELSDIWNNGFVFVNSIRKIDNIALYVSKYLTKEVCSVVNKRAFFYSLNCLKPVIKRLKAEIHQYLFSSGIWLKSLYSAFFEGLDYVPAFSYNVYRLIS